AATAAVMIAVVGPMAWRNAHQDTVAGNRLAQTPNHSEQTVATPTVEPVVTTTLPKDLNLNALAPLEKEMKSVQVDLKKAMEVAIASLPLDEAGRISP